MKRKATSPRIAPQSAEYYQSVHSSLHAGLEYTLDAFPDIYRRTLHGLAGTFSRGELMLMVDVFNGTILTPGLAGRHLDIQVLDGLEMDGLGQKWVVDPETFEKKLRDLSLFERACLEIWATGFWQGKGETEPKNLEAWVAQLL